MSRCPSPQQLQELLAQGLPGPDAEAVEVHVQTCGACQQTLERLTAARASGSGAEGFPTRAAGPALPPTEPGLHFLLRLAEKPPAGEHESPARPPRRDDPSAAGTKPGEPESLQDWPEIPGYTLLGELGHGGMGVVYQARQDLLDRLVALKVISRQLGSHPEALRRFCREMQATARLAHPNIVTVHDAGLVGDRPFFTMEYLQGTDLAAHVRQHGPLPIGRACAYVRQAALGLQHALERGLVHRDVKPANLFLISGGEVVKVLDLGLARLLGTPGQSGGSALTRAGGVLGTPDFVAPEQLRDPHSADTRADLYSLGGTLYFLLTGKVPFPGGATVEKVARQLTSEPAPVESLRPEVPSALAAIVRRLLAKRPEDRYQTPGELSKALERLGLEPTPHTGRPARLPLWLLTSMLAGTVLVVLAVLALLAWKGSSPQVQAPKDSSLETTHREGSSGKEPPQPQEGAEEAVAALIALGVTVERDEQRPGRPVVTVRLGGSKATDADLVHLEALPELEFVELKEGISDRGLVHLRRLTKIRWLGAGGVQIGDEGLMVIQGLPELLSLSLEKSTISDAGLAQLKDCSKLLVLSLSGTQVGDTGLAQLHGLDQLNFLYLSNSRVTDAGLQHLKGMRQLTVLELEHLPVTAVGLACLDNLPRLQQLNLNQTPTGDREAQVLEGFRQLQLLLLNETKMSAAGLARLGRLTELRALTLERTSLDDAGMRHLKDLRELTRLEIAGTQVGDDGLASLQNMKKLQLLQLNDTQITDAGLEHLKGLTALEDLRLRGTKVGDPGLKHLFGLTRLQSLSVQGTQVTADGIEALRKALPQVQVYR